MHEVNYFSPAVTDVLAKTLKTCRKLNCICLLSRLDASHSRTVHRVQHTGPFSSGRTQPGTMGSRGQPRLATSLQVIYLMIMLLVTFLIKLCKLSYEKEWSKQNLVFLSFDRCLPGVNQHQFLPHMPPSHMPGLNHPSKFLNNGWVFIKLYSCFTNASGRSLLMCPCISSPLHRGDKQDLSQALLPGLQRMPPAPPRPWEPTRTGQGYEPLPGDNHNRLHNGYNAGPPAHLTARANQLLKVIIDLIFHNYTFYMLFCYRKINRVLV